MRDPLRNVSVRYKLAFAFLGICLLAFGVGGYLVSRSARASLEREILASLRLRSQFHATVFENGLHALSRRAHDFASDGFIRTSFEQLEGEEQRAALRQHLVENKLSLEPAFLNMALVDGPGRPAFLAIEEDDGGWTRELPRDAFGEADWFSGLLVFEGEEPPTFVVSTPVSDLLGERRLGTLLFRINASVWIAGALGSSAGGGEEAWPELELCLFDQAGTALEIPAAWVTEPPPASSRVVRDSLGLRVRTPVPERGELRRAASGVLSQRFPVALNGWSLETTLNARDALAAVSGLQARLLLLGLGLTTAACVILLFPMRFLARPIGRLNDAAIHIREGDFSARVPIESSDEIGELSQSFNLMAEAVEARTQELSSVAASLAQRKNELRRERDRLNAVIHSMRDALIVVDSKGEPEVWNGAAEPLLSVVRDGGFELDAHRNCSKAEEYAAAGAPAAEPGQNGAGNGYDHPCLGCVFEPSAPARSCLIDAGSLVFEVHSTRLTSDVNGGQGRVLVARDVTDRIARDEGEIHQERLAVLGEVAAVMAHELNNPLAAIKMFTQMIESKLPAESPLREDVSVIERNTLTCTRTIRELLDYATGATPEVGPVDVHANLRDVAHFLRAFRERKDTELVLELEAQDPFVVGDEVQLRQVFVNLVLNALQALPESGQGRVSVRSSLDGNHLTVDVQDTGPGIAPENQEAIFRPFFTTKSRGSGTGLGLSTARRITEIQGGSLELLDGCPGQTTFRVRLLRENP